MKRILFFLSLIVITVGCTRAQNSGNIQNIPDYRILDADSVYRTPANLKKNQPVMIVYFSPDCSHCQHLMDEIKGQMKNFSKIQIVMVSAVDYRMIKGFYKDFGISAYPNITVGTEGNSYKVLQYYNVKTTPYIAIYNHQHKLLKAYEKAPKIEDLAAIVKKA
ncbi:protein disulfide isomerase family protein [Mucilaginibacter sp. CSA2-8R]|uniref:TlpA family protein disulfide reductase n=1 Tax=Mucilaginibacter sp. CSA2-8R TaxID=3141542 RepID=UPI00315C87C7